MQRTDNFRATLVLAAFCAIGLNSQRAQADDVEVRIAGAFQNAQQDKRLRDFLREPYAFQWNAETTANDIARDLSTRVPFLVDHRGLEEMGVSANNALHSAFRNPAAKKLDHKDPKTKKDAPNSIDTHFDPFAKAKTERSTKNQTTTKQDTEVQLVRWWDKADTASSFTTPDAKTDTTNAAMLFHFLDASDLTINNRLGQWLITTRERAEETQSVRLYDVTRITMIGDRRPSTESQTPAFGFCGSMSAPVFDPLSLVQSVENSIVPDTWESLGGPSTIYSINVDGRQWMVVTTMVTVHWQIEEYLNQLAR